MNRLGKDINIAILKGENVAELFQQLEKLDKDATQESAFLRGVRYMRTLQVPLETLKLGLDLASPLTSLDPTAATVFGVVKSVTAVSSPESAALLWNSHSYLQNRLPSAFRRQIASLESKSGNYCSNCPQLDLTDKLCVVWV